MSLAPFLLVLGVAQDGGHPQPGCTRTCCAEGSARHLASSLAVVDPAAGARWLVDATPAFPEQVARLAAAAAGPLSGILLTHAHIGHYTGLQYLGREVMGTRGLPVHAMPRMAAYLANNGPWSQLVALGNIELAVASEVALSPSVRATALVVPHRDELSETVAWRIAGPTRSALWLPDIDRWESWARASRTRSPGWTRRGSTGPSGRTGSCRGTWPRCRTRASPTPSRG